MWPRARERCRRLLRWVVPGTVLVLAPKCVLCIAGYLGLGAALGLTGVEVCGAAANDPMHPMVWCALAASSLALGAQAVRVYRSRDR